MGKSMKELLLKANKEAGLATELVESNQERFYRMHGYYATEEDCVRLTDMARREIQFEKGNSMEKCNTILDFWKMLEYFTPADYPEIDPKKEPKIDTSCKTDSEVALPLEKYKSYNESVKQKGKSEEQLYNCVNVYYGCYKVKEFIENMAKKCNLNMEKYGDIYELTGRFYMFRVQIDMDGKLTDEGVQVNPFFYAVLCMLKTESENVNVMNVIISQEDLQTINADINEILKMEETEILKFSDMEYVKYILFNKLGIEPESDLGLVSAWDDSFPREVVLENKVSVSMCACKGVRPSDESDILGSFYLDEIDMVQKNCKDNETVVRYATSMVDKSQEKVMIDIDVDMMQKWLEVDRFPLAKYPSKFSPYLMQQVAINIAISEENRKEKIFSVNGPPGSGKTTLLKEIIASNVEKLAEVLIKYGPDSDMFQRKVIRSTVGTGYVHTYYEIPECIAKYGIIVASNNNSAVENVSLNLPKAGGMEKENTRTGLFDRNIFEEVYFSAVADKLLGEGGAAWGLISARMGKKDYVSEVLESCIFAKSNDPEDKVTLDRASKDTVSWDVAVENFKVAKTKVLSMRDEIKKDQEVLTKLYKEREKLAIKKQATSMWVKDIEVKRLSLDNIRKEQERNEKETLNLEEEIKYIKKHASFVNKLLIAFGVGEAGKNIAKKRKCIDELVRIHEDIKAGFIQSEDTITKMESMLEDMKREVVSLEKAVKQLEEIEKILEVKYKHNLVNNKFYDNIKEAEDSQCACPWTYGEYDKAREELFYASLQVRKAFILNSQCIRRNLFVYEAYNNGSYTKAERQEMFPHLFNALSVVVPVISTTFASVRSLLKYAGNQSLGMLVIDEAGQVIPYSALGAIYRTKRTVVVGDPLQVEPVVTIPQVLADIIGDSLGVSEEYKRIENSVQIYADSVNEFVGKIGDKEVGCPLVVHRRCVEPMFSISNMISYDNRMFRQTPEGKGPYALEKSGWINVVGEEAGPKNHFVKEQAEKVCQIIEQALDVYDNFFEEDEKIFVITPFRLVAASMRKFVQNYFAKKGYDAKKLGEWTKNCIGTVHRFQGKEAQEVLFVLGCSAKSTGAMNWVAKKANILNVACTRAKYRIAFIGNMDNWKNRKYFSDFIPKLIDQIEV